MKKYYAIGLLILIIAFFAYHFYAANNAETNIDSSIQEITANLESQLSVSYSTIEVSPFTGNIHFTDLIIIRNKHIRRARSLKFDFSYLDFLNISLFGPEYGLKKINNGIMRLKEVSLTNRESLSEVKLDSLSVNYKGDLWGLLALSFRDSSSAINYQHHFGATGNGFTFSQPGNLGIVKADTLIFENSFINVQGSMNDSLSGSASLLGITWNPPKFFQGKYQFFIQGFGYRADSIPFQKVYSKYSYESETRLLSINKLTIQSELFNGSLSGVIKIDSTAFSESLIEGVTIQISSLSPQLQSFLSNAEKLFGITIPMDDQQLTISVDGILKQPKIKLTDK